MVSIPVCLYCRASGPGHEFPLWPESGWRFGTICAVCDPVIAAAKMTIEDIERGDYASSSGSRT